MKRVFAITCLLQFIVVATTTLPASASGKQIVPGRSIDSLHLGARDTVLKKLAPLPGYEEDSTMGHTWRAFRSSDGSHSLEVYMVRDDPGLITTIRQIRIASPYFHTSQGIHTGDSLSHILKAFPGVKLISRYTYTSKRVDVYDDRKRGIAFEFKPATTTSNEQCTAILIHPRGKSVTEEYMSEYKNLDGKPAG